jgi:hypothetical protein
MHVEMKLHTFAYCKYKACKGTKKEISKKTISQHFRLVTMLQWKERALKNVKKLLKPNFTFT